MYNIEEVLCLQCNVHGVPCPRRPISTEDYIQGVLCLGSAMSKEVLCPESPMSNIKEALYPRSTISREFYVRGSPMSKESNIEEFLCLQIHMCRESYIQVDHICAYVQGVLCAGSAMFRDSCYSVRLHLGSPISREYYIQGVLCQRKFFVRGSPISTNSYVQGVLCSISKKSYVQRVLCPGRPICPEVLYPGSLMSKESNIEEVLWELLCQLHRLCPGSPTSS